MGELNRFLTEYCALWRSTGYKLGLEDAVLNVIQSDYSEQRERFRVTLQKWLEQDTRPTWITLELAITNAHREELSLAPLKESKKIYIIIHICITFFNIFISKQVDITISKNQVLQIYLV